MAEQVGRKKGMARTDVSQTRLQDPDLTAAGFSREGVVDRSGLFEGEAAARQAETIAGGIRDFGQVALDIDEGIAKAKLEEDLMSEVDAAFASREPGFAEDQMRKQQEAALSFTAEQAKANILREELGEGAAIASLDPDFAETSRKLARAKRTGIISVDEFELRTKEALRRAVSRRPGLLNELTQHAQTILGLTNASDRLAFMDQQAAMEGQEEAARRDRAIKQLDKEGLAFDFEAPTEKLERKLNNFRRQETAYQEGKRIREINQAVNQEEGLSILRDGGGDFAAGAYQNASQTMIDMFAPGMSSKELSTAKIRVNDIITQKREEFDSLGRNLNITNTQEFKDLKSNWMGALENLAETLENAGSAEEAARIAKNHMAIIQNQHERQVYELGVNPVLARVAGHMEKFIEGNELLLRRQDLQTKLANGYESLLTGAIGGGATEKLLGSSVNGKDSDLSLILESTAKSALPKDRLGNPDDFETMVESAIETIENSIGKNQSVAFKTMTDTIRKLSDPSVRENLDRASSSTKASLIDLGIRQASALEPDRNRFLRNASEKGVNIRNRVLPNGTLQFYTEGDTPEDRKLLKQFNSKFTKKYNDLIRFKATMFGMTVPQASDLLAEIYSGGSVEEIRQAIDTRREKLEVSQVSDEFINSLVQAESSGRADASNERSTALGAAQFIDSTWMEMIKKHAPRLAEGKDTQEILELRKNPEISKNMAKAYAQDNGKVLKSHGLETNDVNLLLSHFLGPTGAVNILSSSLDTPVEDILGRRVIMANKEVLEGKKVGDVIEWARGKFSND